ncbi:MAG: hypothetical protein ACKVQU_24525 [Burkholderiales bacterium]
MKFRVYLLRERGRKRLWRDVRNGPSFVGDLRTASQMGPDGHYQFASLHSDSPMLDPVIPNLFNPTLHSVAVQAMRLRGIERLDSPDGLIAVVQEWYCEADQ